MSGGSIKFTMRERDESNDDVKRPIVDNHVIVYNVCCYGFTYGYIKKKKIKSNVRLIKYTILKIYMYGTL